MKETTVIGAESLKRVFFSFQMVSGLVNSRPSWVYCALC